MFIVFKLINKQQYNYIVYIYYFSIFSNVACYAYVFFLHQTYEFYVLFVFHKFLFLTSRTIRRMTMTRPRARRKTKARKVGPCVPDQQL